MARVMKLEKASLKKISLKLLIAVLAVLLIGTVLTACDKSGSTVNFDYTVVFDYNDGNLVDKNNRKDSQVLGVFENSLVSINPGYAGFEEAAYSEFYVEGWYLPLLNDDGNVVREDGEGNRFVVKNDGNRYDLEDNQLPALQPAEPNGEVYDDSRVVLGDKWEFSEDRVNSDITLYANLQVKPMLVFVDIESGDRIMTISDRPEARRDKPSDTRAPSKNGYTFLGKYYTSTDRAEEVTWPHVFGSTDEDIYVDMVEGTWDVVSTASDFVKSLNAGKNIYLMNDIDFATFTDPKTPSKRLWTPGTYNGEFNGNGHTVKNVTRNIIASRTANASQGLYSSVNCAGIFGTLGAKANIHDVTFDNVAVTYDVNSSITATNLFVGLFAWKAEDGAKIKNVTIVNSSISYKELSGGVRGSAWIAQDSTKTENVVDCDYSGVTVNVLDAENSEE